MLTVVCFYWFDPHNMRNDVYIYKPRHVLALKRQVEKHLSLPHQFVCVTDQPEKFDGRIKTVPMDRTTFVSGTRFVKLMLWRKDIGDILGKRILYLDLDTVIVDAIDPLVDRNEDLVLWRNPNFGPERPRRAFYNTSIMLMDAGCRPRFYDDFDRIKSPALLAKRWGGTDQAWVSHMASKDEAYWDASWGVYGAGRLGDTAKGVRTTLPANARVVFFPGKRIPDQADTKHRHPWIAEHYYA